jgi:hypothetical protein
MTASSTLSESLNDLHIWRRRPSPSLPPPCRGVQLRVAPHAHNHPRLSLHLSPKPHPHHGTQPKPRSVPLHHCLPRLPASPTFASCLLPCPLFVLYEEEGDGVGERERPTCAWLWRRAGRRAALAAASREEQGGDVEEEGGARWRCHRWQCDRSACDGARERRRRTIIVGEGHDSLLPSTRRLCRGLREHNHVEEDGGGGEAQGRGIVAGAGADFPCAAAQT